MATTTYSVRMVNGIGGNLRTKSVQEYITSDSRHYYEIAEEFTRGDFRMRYVRRNRSHRQPLYPLLLAVPMRLSLGDVLPLSLVNVVIANAFVFASYLFARRLFASRIAGLCAALVVISDQFLFANITSMLLTEPLFAILLFGTGALFVRYVVSGGSRDLPARGKSHPGCERVFERNSASLKLALSPDKAPSSLLDLHSNPSPSPAEHSHHGLLYGAAALAWLSYLTRPNGLFVIVSLATVWLLHELSAAFRQKDQRSGKLRELAARGALFAGIVILVTVPSWLPRVWYHGNPIYHGYLTNYLWADTYKEATVIGPPRFGPRHYMANHNLRDAADRFAYGFRVVYYEIGYQYRWPASCFAVMGLVIGCFSRTPQWRLLALFMFIQTLPLAWTFTSNPTPRIPHATLLPFVVLYVGVFAASAVRFAGRAWQEASVAARRRFGRTSAEKGSGTFVT